MSFVSAALFCQKTVFNDSELVTCVCLGDTVIASENASIDQNKIKQNRHSDSEKLTNVYLTYVTLAQKFQRKHEMKQKFDDK